MEKKIIKRIDLSRGYFEHQEEYMQAIERVCMDTAYSGGKYADKFDKEFAAFCNVKYASGVNNGTSALHCAMIALGVGIGDEVIVPANTFIATAWAVSYTGATPVFVDCTKDTWEIDPDKIEEKITDRTKGIIGVHLYGQPFEYRSVRNIAEKYGLFVVEDCAQAHGALYEGKKVGSLGELGCFSFYPGKNLYAFGEGGSVTTDNEAYYRHVERLKNQGSDKTYCHTELGYNMRLEGMQGAVLSVSLQYLDEWTNNRQKIGAQYDTQIMNDRLTKQYHPENTTSVYHLYEVLTEEPEDFIEFMKVRNIECHRHYPIPCHLQEAYKHLNYNEGDCPNAEYVANHCVTLPLYPEMRQDEINAVIKACNEYVN